MDIKRVGSSTSTKGPAEYFTGMVRIDKHYLRWFTDTRRVRARARTETVPAYRLLSTQPPEPAQERTLLEFSVCAKALNRFAILARRGLS